MANRAGLKKVVKTVRSKKGTVKRSYWVRAGETVKSGARKVADFVGRHKGKIAAGAAAAGLVGLAAMNRHKIAGARRGLGLVLNAHKHGHMEGIPLRDWGLHIASQAARAGWKSNRDMDKTASAITGAAGRASTRIGGAARGAADRVSGLASDARSAVSAARGQYAEGRRGGVSRRNALSAAASGARNSYRTARKSRQPVAAPPASSPGYGS